MTGKTFTLAGERERLVGKRQALEELAPILEAGMDHDQIVEMFAKLLKATDRGIEQVEQQISDSLEP